jgi:hypothetical protein
MRRLITTLTATGAAAIALASVTPAMAEYVAPASGQNPASAGNGLPAAGANAPGQSPLVPLGAVGVGILLVGAGGSTLARRRVSNR